jgi:hypothetical protein
MANGTLGQLDEQQLKRLHDYLMESVGGTAKAQQQILQMGLESKESRDLAQAMAQYQREMQPRETAYDYTQPGQYPTTERGETAFGPPTAPQTARRTFTMEPSAEQRRAAEGRALAKMLTFRTGPAQYGATLFARTMERPDTSLDLNELFYRASQGDPIAQSALQSRQAYERSLRTPRANVEREYVVIDKKSGKPVRYRDTLTPEGSLVQREALGEEFVRPTGAAAGSATLKTLESRKNALGQVIAKRYPSVDMDQVLIDGVMPRRFKAGADTSNLPNPDPNAPENVADTEEIPEVKQWLQALDLYEARAQIEGVEIGPAETLAAEKKAKRAPPAGGNDPLGIR